MKTKENKIDYNHGSFMLLDTDPCQYAYEDYLEDCEETGEDSVDFWEWCAEQVKNDCEADLCNIKCCKQYNVPCIVTGSLGLWDGRHEIRAKRFETVYDAVVACLGDFDCEAVVRYEDGRIDVIVNHHDGQNCFEIMALSQKGIAKTGDNYAKHDTKRLPYLYAIYE